MMAVSFNSHRGAHTPRWRRQFSHSGIWGENYVQHERNGSGASREDAALGHGLTNLSAIHRNLSVPVLYEHAIRNGEGRIAHGGAFVAVTGQHTGRSPKDKYLVKEASTEGDIAWGDVNIPVSEAVFDQIHQRMLAYFQRRHAYVADVYAGADPEYRLPVRVVTE